VSVCILAFVICLASHIFSASCYVICYLCDYTVFFLYYVIIGMIFKKRRLNIKWSVMHSFTKQVVHGAACWNLYREGQIHVLDRVQKKAAKFAHHTN
jgi:hypothetical protein